MNGESFKQTMQGRTDRNQESLVCPVCDKRAAIRYFDHTAKKWVYKHPRNLRRSRFNVSETIYHQSDV